MKPLSIAILSALLGAATAQAQAPAQDANLERELAITRDDTLKALEKSGFALADLLTRTSTAGVIDNNELSKLAVFKPVLDGLKNDVATFKSKHPKAGVGLGFDERLFDLKYLENDKARFVLVGVVGRMDNGYKEQNRCGETRLIYRLAYNVQDHGAPVSSRLPMTINMVYHAGTQTDDGACAQLASAWQKISADSSLQDLTQSGPLSAKFFSRDRLKDLETNLQIVRLPASSRPDFGGHAEYLLKVFHWNGAGLEESTMENQIDRDKLLASPDLLKELKKWVLDPANTQAIDRGIHVIPQKFLAKSALSISPAGLERSANRVFDGLLQRDDFAQVNYAKLELIKSPAGFLHRLNESTCIGCHQTRAIAGFHFMGKDPSGRYPGNSVFLPASAHFYGDSERRRAIVDAVAAVAASIDYSRGFAARPQMRRSQSFDDTGLVNGWGAHCSLAKDPTFQGWTCADGLVCKALLDAKDGFGTCIDQTQKVGDPCESGVIKTTAFGVDAYKKTSPDHPVITVNDGKCSPQSQEPGTKTGGFLNGSIRTQSCQSLPAEASCGPLPAARPGFNSCLGHRNFGDCIKEYVLPVGMRGCDQKNPCRDDYICSESYEDKRGSCIPPYFLFQFRVDGHPI